MRIHPCSTSYCWAIERVGRQDVSTAAPFDDHHSDQAPAPQPVVPPCAVSLCHARRLKGVSYRGHDVSWVTVKVGVAASVTVLAGAAVTVGRRVAAASCTVSGEAVRVTPSAVALDRVAVTGSVTGSLMISVAGSMAGSSGVGEAVAGADVGVETAEAVAGGSRSDNADKGADVSETEAIGVPVADPWTTIVARAGRGVGRANVSGSLAAVQMITATSVATSKRVINHAATRARCVCTSVLLV